MIAAPSDRLALGGLTRTWTLALIAVLAGTVNVIALLGWDALDPRNIEWLKGDPATHYLGWAFYRHEDTWSVPLTWTTRLGYPVGVSIAFLDSIPLIAVLLRPVAGLLPEPFQYLGIYTWLSLVLQAYFGFVLCRRLYHDHPLFTIVGGLFLVSSPALAYRLHGHFALASHWVIVAGLCAYFRPPANLSLLRWASPLFALVILAGAINPYLGVLGFLIGAAGLAHFTLERQSSGLRGLGYVGLLALALLASLLLFGFIVGFDRSAYRAPGFGIFSLNLLAPINGAGVARVFPALPLVHPEQRFEGFGYLGIGIIGLLALNLIGHPVKAFRLIDRRAGPLVVLALVCTLVAASSTITLGPWTLIHVTPPRIFDLFTSSFRSSGRFFWVTHYLLIVTALTLTFEFGRPRVREALVVLALVAQIADTAPLRAHVRGHHESRVESPLRSHVWRELGTRHQRLLVVPPWICPTTPGGPDSFWFFGQVAASQHMVTNTYYPGRPGLRAIHEHCHSIPLTVMAGVLDPKAAYVVNDEVMAALRAKGSTTHGCERVDGFILCTTLDPSGPADPRIPVYGVGTLLDFSAHGNAGPYMLFGWSSPETSGTWTVGPEAALLMRLAPPRGAAFELTADVAPFLTPHHRKLKVDIIVNDTIIDQWRFTSSKQRGTKRTVVRDVVGDGPMLLRFRMWGARSPASLRLSSDARTLGLYVHTLRISSADPR